MTAGGNDCSGTLNALLHQTSGGQCINHAGKPDDAVWYDLDAQ